MSPRALWTIVLVLCIVAVVGGSFYSFGAPGGQVLHLLLAIPFIVLARMAWRRLRHAA